MERNRVNRALVLCGRSVHERTNLIQRIETLGAAHIAGVFPGITEGAPAECIEAAAEKARAVEADALVAVGAGSVINGARVVAMLLAEKRPLLDMATAYHSNEPPRSVRLDAAKMPIFNVLTSPTSAQNRGGSAVRYKGAVHHLEFFDPKTRPRAVFWDADALMTAPLTLVRSTSFEVYWWSLMCMGAVRDANPLVQGDRYNAWRLAKSAYPRLGIDDDSAARIDLCAAALLQNRDEEDGGRPWSCHLLARAAYASAVAVFNSYKGVTQSRGYAAFAPYMIRELGPYVPGVTRALGEALGADLSEVKDDTKLALGVAARFEQNFKMIGWRPDLGDLDILASDAPNILRLALHNFNANHDRMLDEYHDKILSGISKAITIEKESC